MNAFMNKVALNTFSSFDSGNKPSEQTEPERFYHGFVLGMVVNLADSYKVRSNRESGFGRYDVMIEPHDKTKKAFIIELKSWILMRMKKHLKIPLRMPISRLKRNSMRQNSQHLDFPRRRFVNMDLHLRGKSV